MRTRISGGGAGARSIRPPARSGILFRRPDRALQLRWQLLRISRPKQLDVEALARPKLILRCADNQPKHFGVGIVENLSHHLRNHEQASELVRRPPSARPQADSDRAEAPATSPTPPAQRRPTPGFSRVFVPANHRGHNPSLPRLLVSSAWLECWQIKQ